VEDLALVQTKEVDPHSSNAPRFTIFMISCM